MSQVHLEIERIIQQIKTKQSEDGAWRYCFETGPMTDAYMIIILRTLEYREEELIKKLVHKLLNKQCDNGAWKLYDDDECSATVESYTALLFSGYLTTSDRNMKRAEKFIICNGGLEKVHISTKFMLALNNQYPWPKFYPIPLFLMHLPRFFSISFYRLSSYVRAHFAPTLILGHQKFSITNQWTPDLTHLFVGKKRKQLVKKMKWINFFTKRLFSNPISKSAILKAERYMLQNIESDGTLYSYASATFFMIYALLSLGYQPGSPIIQNAIQGIKSFLYKIDEDYHIQNSPSTIWDTALISYALQEAELTGDDPSIQASANYLLSVQQKNTDLHHIPGGWGFSESNSLNPDVDDTQAVLRAITGYSQTKLKYRSAWNSGVNWLLSMQNDDGGWGAFEKNSSKYIKKLFPIQNFADTAIDPSAADLTGRTLEFLGSNLKLTINHPRVKESVDWLITNQKSDGSWYGRWGISYIYGTWAAVTGMRAVGVPTNDPSIQKAIQWLLNIKQLDGGWGESCKSDVQREYIPSPYSTVVHTAWAVDILISTFNHSTEEMEVGVLKILEWNKEMNKRTSYPTGAGLPGHFYIHYHSYQDIWPLLTLSHYRRKYGEPSSYSM